VQPPTLDQWISGLQAILGIHVEGKGRTRGGESLSLPTGWDELNTAEEIELGFANAQPLDDIRATTPWLRATESIAGQYGFFHWELDFASIFANGGFDLQVGNPPWVRPRSDVDALLAEGDPWWQLKAKSTADQDERHRVDALDVEGVAELVVDGTAEVAATAAFVGNPQMYPYLAGLQPDLYRCFMSQTWSHARPGGSVGLIHPESHFTDEKAGRLRKGTYRRLRRHWQFINELSLFEVHNLVSYGVHIYGDDRSPSFIQATSLYHPSTIEGSLRHDGSGIEPGLKDDDGRWDLRPHASRIQRVDEATLSTWHEVMEDATVPAAQARMVYTVNRASAAVLAKLAAAPRIGSLGLQFSAGWHEKNDRTKGYFDSEWGVPESWDSVILQGPHLHVGTPFYKSPNPTMLHNRDWTAVDLEALPPDAIPVTQYKPAGDRARYAASYGSWESPEGPISTRDLYRIAWRTMAANTGERTLIPTLIPPKAAHIHRVSSVGGATITYRSLALALGFLSSLVGDALVRAVPKSDILMSTIIRLPYVGDSAFVDQILDRVLRWNCLTRAYAPLWAEITHSEWSPDVAYRRAADRRLAQVEIDALVGMSLGITADELTTLYRTQFPVLYKYDHEDYLYDANGRIVPTSVRQAWKRLGEPTDTARFPESERTAIHPGSGVTYRYDLPFAILDREADLRRAYADFAGPAVNRTSELIARV
jgi:hypothetical protein